MNKRQIVIEGLLIIIGIAFMVFALTQPFPSYSYIVDKILRLLFLLMPLFAMIGIYAYIQHFYKHDETKTVIRNVMIVVFIIYMILAKKHGY